MKIHFLGTNGWFNSPTGETPCILIDSKEAYVIFDAGNAFRKIDQYISDTTKPIFLFLSHFHLDHINGLHTLAKFKFPQGIKIVGQPGTREALSCLISKPFSVPLNIINKTMLVQIVEIKEDKTNIGIHVEARFLVHADPCLGYSLELEGKKIVYCTDTGLCNNLIRLAKDADLLITECTWRERNQSPDWPHLAPEDAAEAAQKANAKMLFLTHFDAENYSTLKERKRAEVRAKKIFPNTFATLDGMSVSL